MEIYFLVKLNTFLCIYWWNVFWRLFLSIIPPENAGFIFFTINFKSKYCFWLKNSMFVAFKGNCKPFRKVTYCERLGLAFFKELKLLLWCFSLFETSWCFKLNILSIKRPFQFLCWSLMQFCEAFMQFFWYPCMISCNCIITCTTEGIEFAERKLIAKTFLRLKEKLILTAS